jgi:hypothetical protein
MRNILLATVLAFSALVPATLQTAEACGGGYGTGPAWNTWRPTVRTVSRHSMKGEKTASFILLDKRLPAKAAAKMRFTQLDPMSFDTTATAPGEKLAKPMMLTLVGPAGTKVIKATQFTWVDVAFEHDGPRAGIRIEGDYRIALDGELPDATWEELSQMHGSTVTVSTVAGTQLVSAHGSGSTAIGNTRRTLDGSPVGVVHVGGTPFVVMASSTKRNALTAEIL